MHLLAMSKLQWRALPAAKSTAMFIQCPGKAMRGVTARRGCSRERLLCSAQGGQQGSQFDGASLSPGSKDVQAAFHAAETKIKRGDMEGAKRTLHDAIRIISEDYGDTVDLMGILHTQLYQLYFREGQYQQALEQAKAAFDATARAFGRDSNEAHLHGMRFGIALLACGDALAALPHLMASGTMLEAQVRAVREELRQAITTGRQLTLSDMLTASHLVAASAESKLYAALCMLRLAEPGSMGQDDRAQQMLLSGAEELAQVLPSGNDVMRCALREHQRLIDDCQASGDGALMARLAEQHSLLLKTIEEVNDPYMP